MPRAHPSALGLPTAPASPGRRVRATLARSKPSAQRPRPRHRPGCALCSAPLRVPSSCTGLNLGGARRGFRPRPARPSLAPSPPPAGSAQARRAGGPATAPSPPERRRRPAAARHGSGAATAAASRALRGARRARAFCAGLGRPKARPLGDSQGDRVAGCNLLSCGPGAWGSFGTGTSVSGGKEGAEDGRRRQGPRAAGGRPSSDCLGGAGPSTSNPPRPRRRLFGLNLLGPT